MLGIAASAGVLATYASSDTQESSPPPKAVKTSSAFYQEPGCTDFVRAITYYRRAYAGWRGKMQLEGPVPRVWYQDCDALRRRAVEWRDKADVARIEYIEWHAYHWRWEDWLPDGWARIGACETGYGRIPGNWAHNSGTYQGAFGFHYDSWDSFVGSADPAAGPYPSEAHHATPRQQYEVALAIYRRYGLSGWGCRGSY